MNFSAPHRPDSAHKPEPSRFASLLRGGAVGATEALPGISGGTVALIVRLYDDLIVGAGHTVSGIRAAITDGLAGKGLGRARARFALAPWRVLVPALVGMVLFLLITLVAIAPIVEEHTQYAYALFFGLVLASVWIPYSGAGTWRGRDFALAGIFAAAAFALMSLPGADLPVNSVVVFFAASVAICALVLPGTSGSFILLMVGLYEPTLDAVRNVDIGYIAAFAGGALTGLALFVKLLQHLLEFRRHITLVVLTGIMAGSLRALWPWQDEDRVLQTPSAVPLTLLFMVIGFAAVAGALFWEHRKAAAAKVRDREAVSS